MFLQVEEASGLEFPASAERLVIIMQRKAYFCYLLILKKRYQGIGDANAVEPDEKAGVGCR